MITVSLMGGLGNQMFQYAAGKALAVRHGVPLALDISGFRNSTDRSFLLDRLSIPEADRAFALEVGAEKVLPVDHFVLSLWKRRIDRVLESAGLPKLVNPPISTVNRTFTMIQSLRRLVRRPLYSAIFRVSVISAQSINPCAAGFHPASRLAFERLKCLLR